MFPGCLQDFSRMFSGCSDGSYWPGGIWWSFQMKVWTLMVQRNPLIPNYSMIPAIRRSAAIRWTIGSMDFDNPKVYGDTSITDGLVRSQIIEFNRSKDLDDTALPPSPPFSILEFIGGRLFIVFLPWFIFYYSYHIRPSSFIGIFQSKLNINVASKT